MFLVAESAVLYVDRFSCAAKWLSTEPLAFAFRRAFVLASMVWGFQFHKIHLSFITGHMRAFCDVLCSAASETYAST